MRERSLRNVEGSVLVPVKTKRVEHLCEKICEILTMATGCGIFIARMDDFYQGT